MYQVHVTATSFFNSVEAMILAEELNAVTVDNKRLDKLVLTFESLEDVFNACQAFIVGGDSIEVMAEIVESSATTHPLIYWAAEEN